MSQAPLGLEPDHFQATCPIGVGLGYLGLFVWQQSPTYPATHTVPPEAVFSWVSELQLCLLYVLVLDPFHSSLL